MRQYVKYSALASVISSLVACGGGSGSAEVTSQVSGSVADGYLRGAVVCLDQDLDGSCVGEAVKTTSTAGGKYSLTVPSGVNESAFPVVVEVGTDAFDEGDPSSSDPAVRVKEGYTLASPPGKSAFVSPLTTLIYKIARNNTAAELKRVEDEIKDQMGISGSATDLYADFVSKSVTGNETSEYTKLFRTAQLLARNFATTETAIKNISSNKADVSKVASLKAMEQLNTISGIVTTNSENFNIEALVKQNKTKWQDAVKNIKSVDDIAKIKSAAKLPRVFDAGVYQFVDKTISPAVDTKEAMIIFFAKKADFASWDILLHDSFGNLVYSFKESDIDRPLFTSASYIAFSTELPSLTNGEYTFIAKAKDGQSDGFELFTTTLATASIDTTPVSVAEAGASLNSRVNGADNRLMVSVPYGEKDIRYAALLKNANDDILDINTWRKGKNFFYFNTKYKDTGVNIQVYGNDGGRLADSNIVFKRVNKAVQLTDAATEFSWARANVFTTNVDNSSLYTEITFNTDLEGDKDVQELPLSTLVVSHFDGGTYVKKAICSQSGGNVTCNKPGIEVSTEFFSANGSGYSTHFYGVNNELIETTPSMVFPTGNYKIEVTDTAGKSDVGFVNLGSNQYTAFSVNGSDLTIDSTADLKDGWMDASIANIVSGYYYRVDFRIEYTRKSDSKSKTAYVGKTPSSASGTAVYPVALLKSKVEKRIATLKAGGHTPNKLVVRLNAFDALDSSNQNNSWYTGETPTGYFTELF